MRLCTEDFVTLLLTNVSNIGRPDTHVEYSFLGWVTFVGVAFCVGIVMADPADFKG